MEASKHRQIPRRLLAFALTVILVLSLLPANLLTVWADTGDITIHIDQDREGKLYLVLDDTETELELEQDQVDVTINPDNYSKIKLKMEPVNGNQVAVYARVGNHDTEVNKKNETPFVVTLKDQDTNNITGNLFDDDTLYIVVVFGQLFKALPGQGDVTITAQGYYLPSETAITLPEEGLKLNEKQLVTSPSDPANNGVKVTVKPVDGCAIQSVNINGATQITLNGDGQFTLKKNYFNADGIAVINAVTTGTPTAEPYKLDPVTLENCTATITRGSNEPEELASGAEITAEELTAENVTLKFTGISESYKVSSVKINNQEKAESEVGAASFSYVLKQADFGTEKTIGVSAVFAEPDQPTPDYTLHFAMSGGEGTATIKKKNAGEQTEPLTDGMGLYAADLPAVLTFTAPEDMVLDELVIGSTTITYPANQNKSSDTFELKAEHFQNGSLTISVSFRDQVVTPKYSLTLADESSANAQVFAAVKSSDQADYPEDGVAITAGNPLEVNAGDSAKVTVTADDGYFLTGVKDGDDTPADLTMDATRATFELSGISANHTIKVETVEAVTVTAKKLNHATIKLVCGNLEAEAKNKDAVLTVPKNAKVDVTVTADNGYGVTSLKKGQESILPPEQANQSPVSVQTTIEETTTITATVSKLYKIQLNAFSNGKVQVVDGNNAQIGADIDSEGYLILQHAQLANARLVFIPETEGGTFVVSDLKIGEGPAQLENNKTPGTITSSKTLDQYEIEGNTLNVEVTFKELFTVTIANAANGTVTANYSNGDYSEDDNFNVLSGDSVSFIATPSSTDEKTYIVQSVELRYGDGAESDYPAFSLSSTNTATFGVTVEKDVTVIVVFDELVSLNKIHYYWGTQEETSYLKPAYSTNDLQVLVFEPYYDEAIKLNMEISGKYANYRVYYNRDFDYLSSVSDDNNRLISESVKIFRLAYSTFFSYVWGVRYYSGFHTLYAPGSSTSTEQNMYIIIDKAAPEIAFEKAYDGQYFSSAPEITFTATDPSDPVTANNQLAANHAFSGIKRAYYYEGEYNDSLNYDSSNVYQLYDREDIRDQSYTQTSTLSELDENGEYKVTIVVEDFAKNKGHKTITVGVNKMLGLSFDEAEPKIVDNGVTWYSQYRYATILVRDANINKSGISLKDVNGNNVALTYVDDDWTEGEDNTYTRRIRFTDGSYPLDSLEYVATADESGTAVSTSIPVNENFGVDTKKPTGTLHINEETTPVWTDTQEDLRFDVFRPGEVTIYAEANDTGIGVSHTYYLVQYFSGENDALYSADALEQSFEQGLWAEYESGIEIAANKRFAVYLRVQDKVGNFKYLSTNGIVTDGEDPTVNISLPATDYTSEDGVTKLYGRDGGVDVNISATVNDREIDSVYSGLKKVSYRISTTELSAAELKADTGWTDDVLGENPTQSKELTISVPKASFNVCRVYVYVKAEDYAGNEKVENVALDIDNTDPQIAIEYITPENDDAPLTVKITYTERNEHFNQTTAENMLVLKGLNSDNEEIELTKGTDYRIVGWTHSLAADNPDADTHIMTVELLTDAKYTVSASFTDLAGNSVASDEESGVLDREPPEGRVFVQEKGIWTKLLNTLTFGLWSNSTVTVMAKAKDATSGIQSVAYYKPSDTEAKNEETLDAITEWIEIEGDWSDENGVVVTTVSPDEEDFVDEHFVIYLRITDNANRSTYVSTDGFVVDHTDPTLTLTLPDTVYMHDETKLYGRDGGDTVDITVVAADPGIYSGIKLVEYEITAADCETETGTLYSFHYERDSGELLNDEYVNPNGGTLVITENGESHQTEGKVPAYEDLVNEWTGTIPVHKDAFNSCDTQIWVKVTDNADNYVEKTVALDIDNTNPTIAIAQDPEGCTTREGADEGYFSAFTALITYTERTHHFNTADAEEKLTITATDASGEITLERGTDYTITWADTSDNEKNLDTDTHVMKVKFLRDGNYKIEANYTDLAGNTATADEMEFTLDVKAPDGTITVEGKGIWDTLLETLTFGLWSTDSLNVTGTAKDAVCNVKSVEYCQIDKTEAMGMTAYEDNSIAWKKVPGEWTTEAIFDVTSIDPDQKCVIYLRLMDRAGNVNIICTDGIVVEQLFEQDDITLGTPKASGKDADGKPIYGIQDGVDNKIGVTVEVQDQEPWSGIKLVTYEITAPGCETEKGTLYSYNYTRDEGDNSNGGHLVIEENGETILDQTGVLPAYEDLTHNWNGTISVDKARFNSCNTLVRVMAWDNAGNYMENGVKLDIDNTAPTIEVSYDTKQNPRAKAGYYTSVTATVTITERDHHFDPAAATAGINVQGFNVNHKDLSVQAGTDYIISDWTPVNADKGDACTHVATIKFTTDAYYELKISYTDRATNKAEPDYEDTFTKDEMKPDGTLKIEKLTKEPWINQVIEALTFALFSRESVEVTHTASDKISPLISVDYFRTNRDTVYTESELAKLDESNWQSVDSKYFAAGSLVVGPDSRSVVYLRVIDAAGNIRYVSTNGFILDATNPTVDQVAPKVTLTQPVNGIYNTNVPIRVEVSDPVRNDSYSGLKEIRYEVRNMGTLTQSGTLYTYSGTAQKQKDLLQKWENDSAITVDTEKNNSNDVEITVFAADNAGNEGKASEKIMIDVTAPTIKVDYDNNDAQNERYFKAARTATITITERNFDANAVTVTVTKNGAAQPVRLTWNENKGGGNGDGTTNTARIVYDTDGEYTFSISCADKAGNKSREADTKLNGVAPDHFIVDLEAPTITVSYDNNDVRNDSYFNRNRTATVTIEEHNFEASKVDVKLTAKRGGQTITLPTVGKWEDNGDRHTAKIPYSEDGDYTFDISYKDMAGNENKPVAFAEGTKAGNEFTVDTTPPEVVLTGVENESANSGKDKIGFTLTATDTNFNEAQFLPVLTAYLYQDGVLDKRQIQLDSYLKDVENGKQIVIDDLAEDGVYVLTCTVVDRAGNAFTVFDRNDEKDIPANGTENIQLLIFSVNRNGSTFYANDYTIAVLKQYYVKSVDEPIVIYEINPDKLESHSVSLNGSAIDSEITEKTEENWYHYEYDIDKALFDAEGTYNLVVSSVDAAGNSAYSDLKGVKSQSGDGEFSVRFVVDRTAPIVTVSGLEDNGRYQTDAQTVTLVPADDGGLLGSLIVRVMDENGQLINEPWNLQGEDLQKALKDNDGKISFTLAENPDQYYVYIECKDTADNETKLEFKEVTVSTSVFRIFWANKPLRWGSIGGLGGAAALFFFFLLAKKRKKKEDEVVPENKPEKKA